MRVLQAKLLERKRKEERAEMDALKGDGGSSWGNQMRSYVLHPYQMVKDLRTEYEVNNPAAVLDGDIDGFLEAGIRWRNTTRGRRAPYCALDWPRALALVSGAAIFGDWILDRGLRIVLLVHRCDCWPPGSSSGRRADHPAYRREYEESDELVRSEATKHRHAVAQVITWVLMRSVRRSSRVEVTDISDSGRLAGGAGDGARCRARFRCPAHRPGHAGRVLHHHREAVRLR